MKKVLVTTVVKQVVPLIAGAVGAWALTAYPGFHSAFCGAL